MILNQKFHLKKRFLFQHIFWFFNQTELKRFLFIKYFHEFKTNLQWGEFKSDIKNDLVTVLMNHLMTFLVDHAKQGSNFDILSFLKLHYQIIKISASKFSGKLEVLL
jgi:hypothetical protein